MRWQPCDLYVIVYISKALLGICGVYCCALVHVAVCWTVHRTVATHAPRHPRDTGYAGPHV